MPSSQIVYFGRLIEYAADILVNTFVFLIIQDGVTDGGSAKNNIFSENNIMLFQ